MDPPRCDQPGHPRLGADDSSAATRSPRRRGPRRDDAALAVLAERAPRRSAAARTLTQHAVPTTVGARVAGWLRGVSMRAVTFDAVRGFAPRPARRRGRHPRGRSSSSSDPGSRRRRCPALFAAELGLAAPAAPWHTERWPVTELGDALVQAIVAALGLVAADVATLARTEIGEVAEGAGGGSSGHAAEAEPDGIRAHPLRRAPRARTSARRCTLAAALAVDERPDGAWHAEWPTLRRAAAARARRGRHVPRASPTACASTRGRRRATSR